MIMQKTFSTTRALVLGAALVGGGKAAADQAIYENLSVLGNVCVGDDCVYKESFFLDTLRLKDKSTRILFVDTSTLPGFPNNSWQLTANEGPSGGANVFMIEDITHSRQPFKVFANSPTNALVIDPNGNVGIGTGAPILDVHVSTSNTPAHRFEQTSAGGFTAQIWDVAGNDANFFVRDVTGGSRLPFRIRPGAPTSSIDVAANGHVGIGTDSARSNIDIIGSAPNIGLFVKNNAAGGHDWQILSSATAGLSPGGLHFFDNTSGGTRLSLGGTGNVGVGTAVPAAQFHTTGSVRFAGVANCGAGIQSNVIGNLSCLASSRQFKNIAGALPSHVALANVMALRPQTGSYKETPDVPEHWLIAEEVAAIDPALIGLNDGKPYVVKTQNIVADLVAVVQQQQRQIEELRRLVSAKP